MMPYTISSQAATGKVRVWLIGEPVPPEIQAAFERQAESVRRDRARERKDEARPADDELPK